MLVSNVEEKAIAEVLVEVEIAAINRIFELPPAQVRAERSDHEPDVRLHFLGRVLRRSNKHYCRHNERHAEHGRAEKMTCSMPNGCKHSATPELSCNFTLARMRYVNMSAMHCMQPPSPCCAP